MTLWNLIHAVETSFLSFSLSLSFSFYPTTPLSPLPFLSLMMCSIMQRGVQHVRRHEGGREERQGTRGQGPDDQVPGTELGSVGHYRLCCSLQDPRSKNWERRWLSLTLYWARSNPITNMLPSPVTNVALQIIDTSFSWGQKWSQPDQLYVLRLRSCSEIYGGLLQLVIWSSYFFFCFNLDQCPQGVACVLFKKTPTFGSRSSKLDHLTVYLKLLIVAFKIL